MSKREKMLLFATAGVFVILILDQYALAPLFQHQGLLDTQSGQYQTEIDHGRKFLAERKQLKPKWESMLKGGLKDDPAEAEGQLLHALSDWAGEAGLTLSSLKPERPESKERLKEIQLQVVGNGPWESVPKLLFKIQSAPLPLKIMELQLGSRNDASHDVSLQFKISTLYFPPEAKTTKAGKPGNGGTP
jgi:Tfp pilus assembly protein PilO